MTLMHGIIVLWSCVIAVGCARAPGRAQGLDAGETITPTRTGRPFSLCLPPDRSFAVGEEPMDLVVLRGGGRPPTLVVANAGSNDLSLVRRDGQIWTEFQRVKTAPAPFALAVADVNSDRIPDVVAIHRAYPTASIHLGASDGTLGEARTVVLDEPALAFTAGDIDGDGDVELVFAHGADGPQGVLRTVSVDQDGRIRDEARNTLHRHPIAVAAGNTRGDQKRELVVFHYGWKGQSIVTPGRQSLGGTYRRETAIASTTTHGALADLIGDSHLEALSVSLQGYVSKPGLLVVYSDMGYDEFMPQAIIEVPQAPHRVLTHDVDGDGRSDVLVFISVASMLERFPELRLPARLDSLDPTLSGDPSIMQIYGLNEGELELRTEVPMEGLSFVVEDLTGDGTPDLAAVRGRLHVLRDPFTPRSSPSLADGVRSLFAFDVDGDGVEEPVVERNDGCRQLWARGETIQLGPPDPARVPCVRTPRGGGPSAPEGSLWPATATPIELGTVMSTTNILGPVRRVGSGPHPLLMAIRESHRGENAAGLMIAEEEPDLILHLVHGNGEADRLGVLSDEVGESAATFMARDDIHRFPRGASHSSDIAAIASGDLDGDGDIELLLVDRRRRLYVLWGRGVDKFAAPVRWDVGHVLALTVGDLDGDRIDELVTLSDRESVVKIFAPRDVKTPEPVVVFGVGAGTHRLVIADADDDRRADIVLADRFTREFAVLRLAACHGR